MKINTLQSGIKLATATASASAMAITLAMTPIAAHADVNPFSMNALESGYMIARKTAESNYARTVLKN